MNVNKTKSCPFCDGVNLNFNADDKRLMCDTVECNGCGALVPSAEWNTRTDGWIEVDGAKNIPVGDWMVATCDKESKVATHIATCRPNFIVIGGHFHFYMPKVYAYKEIGELPSQPKAASCGE